MRETLDAHGVTRVDLAKARDISGTRSLVEHVLGQAHQSLSGSRSLVGLAPPEGRPLFRAMIEIEQLTATAAAAKGPGVLRAPPVLRCRPPLGCCSGSAATPVGRAERGTPARQRGTGSASGVAVE
ncbi:hypothetical protein [Streptomyces sp. PSAA01]|uniref:hypothetical protein n=1 Tax=Streptomyces sp. PSAA01 TaxID=2912762 RepID=UPI001F34DD7C|nr:hypothetical protein [Streptomyces sp. PSAA01]MCG0284233.1 hypothetical protein [Streptomyces sp. PSAA01]